MKFIKVINLPYEMYIQTSNINCLYIGSSLENNSVALRIEMKGGMSYDLHYPDHKAAQAALDEIIEKAEITIFGMG